MTEEFDRTPAILADVARFAATARRVVTRGRERFMDADDDDQRRIARSLILDLSVAADRLPESFRQSHPDIDWRGIRAVRNFIAHDYDGTDDEILWQVMVVQFPSIMKALQRQKAWTVEDHLREASPEHVSLYHAVAALIAEHGPVTLSVSKTTITFKGIRRGFAGARPTKHGVEGYLDLTRSLAGDPRIRRASPYTKRLFVNHYRVASEADLDATFRGWVAEAYAVGRGDHLAT